MPKSGSTYSAAKCGVSTPTNINRFVELRIESMKKLFFGIIALFLSCHSHAGPDGWIDYGAVTGITEDPGGIYIYTSQAGTGTAGGNACGGNRLYISQVDAERLRSLVYMAYAKRDSLYVYTTECKTQWGTAFTKVYSLYIK